MKLLVNAMTFLFVISALASDGSCLEKYKKGLKNYAITKKFVKKCKDSNSQEDCVEEQVHKAAFVNPREGDIYSGTFLATFGAGLAAHATATSGLILVPVTLVLTYKGAIEVVQVVDNLKEKKMIKLINQSQSYLNRSFATLRVFNRFHKSISKTLEISKDELAQVIIDGNNHGTLCSTDLVSYRSLKRIIKSKEYLKAEL